MKSNDPTQAMPLDDARILGAVRQQQGWLRLLTVLAVVFWMLAVIGSISVLMGYAVFYAPKEKQMFADYQEHGRLTRHTNTNSAAGSEPAGPVDSQQALGLHFTMNYVVTKGILAMAVTMIILSCGTLTTLLLVVVNRRVTLRQINYSLAQISEQLKALQ
jgi:hypothetical protein